MEEQEGNGRIASTFWELHQKLAECYMHDMARPGKPSPAPPSGLLSSLSAKPRALPERRASDGGTSPSITERREVNIGTLLDGKNKAHTETDITLAPHPCWKQRKKPMLSASRTVSVDALMASSVVQAGKTRNSLGADVLDSVELTDRPSRWQSASFALHPGGIYRTIWNMLVALGVLHDLIFVPMYVFELPNTTFFRVMEWITQLFWNFDFVVSVFTGYYDEGVLVRDVRKTFINYAKTWMLFDLGLIAMDWSIVWIDSLGSDQEDLVQWSRTISMLRFLRLIRMLRWVKLRRVNAACL